MQGKLLSLRQRMASAQALDSRTPLDNILWGKTTTNTQIFEEEKNTHNREHASQQHGVITNTIRQTFASKSFNEEDATTSEQRSKTTTVLVY